MGEIPGRQPPESPKAKEDGFMERLKFAGRRLLYMIVMLFGVATMVFILTKLIPGDPAVANLGQRAMSNPEVVAAYRAKYGLDKPLIIQYFMSIILATIICILFGIISAVRRNSILDQGLRVISFTGVSIPSFWFALLVLYFLYYKLQLFPGPGRLSNTFSAPETVTGLYVLDSLLEGNTAKAMDALSHLILPSIVLAAFTMGLITRTTRSNILDVMSTDYIRTAKAKGLSETGLILKHALGNALIPVLTVIGLGLGNLLGGMVLVETIFNWPGVGQFAYESVLSADFPSIIGVALLMVINTVVDILYGIIDPRVRCS